MSPHCYSVNNVPHFIRQSIAVEHLQKRVLFVRCRRAELTSLCFFTLVTLIRQKACCVTGERHVRLLQSTEDVLQNGK